MSKADLIGWAQVFRDTIIPIVVLVVGDYVRRKYGLDIKIMRDGVLEKKAETLVFAAEQAGQSSTDPTPNTAEGKSQKALKDAPTLNVSDKDLDKFRLLIESTLGKINHGAISLPSSASKSPPPIDPESTLIMKHRAFEDIP